MLIAGGHNYTGANAVVTKNVTSNCTVIGCNQYIPPAVN